MENDELLELVHPGEMLRLDFLEPIGITPYRLAKSLGVPATRIGDILHARRDISPETGVLLDTFFGLESPLANGQGAFQRASSQLGYQVSALPAEAGVAEVAVLGGGFHSGSMSTSPPVVI